MFLDYRSDSNRSPVPKFSRNESTQVVSRCPPIARVIIDTPNSLSQGASYQNHFSSILPSSVPLQPAFFVEVLNASYLFLNVRFDLSDGCLRMVARGWILDP